MADKDRELLMGRYRRMYEAWIFGKRVNALSWPAEAFFLRVNLIADDFGNFPAEPFVLIAKAGGLRKLTDVEVTDWIKEMEHKGLIRLYLVDGSDWYGHILSFTRTQPPTGAPRGGRLGRKRQYPESPWDNEDIEPSALADPSIVSKTMDPAVRFVREAKENPCTDCGNQFAYYLMDFDHRPGETKFFKLSDCAGKTITQVKAEMAKCDLVCKHCHGERTHIRSSKGGGPTSSSDKRYDNDNDKDNDKEHRYTIRGMEKGNYILEGFLYWQQKLQHPNAKLSPERVRLLEARWKDSTFDELRLAIDGCESSDFHMGRQPNNPDRYDDITLICRNRSKVEWFGDKVKNLKKDPEDKKKRSDEARRRWSGYE